MRAGGWRESREQPSDRFPGLPSTRLVNKDAEPPEERPPGLPWTGGERRGREESGGGSPRRARGAEKDPPPSSPRCGYRKRGRGRSGGSTDDPGPPGSFLLPVPQFLCL